MKNLCLVMTLLFLALGLGACTVHGPLAIEPIAKGATAIPLNFTESLYRVDRDGTLYFYFSGTVADPVTSEPQTQIALIRMFWTPVGGRTSLNPTSLNASYRYIVATPNAVGMYEGAGFVRNADSPGESTLAARIVDGDLRLTEATANFVDQLGHARIRGTFKAHLNDALTLERMLDARRSFFARSLEISKMPATQPATQDATQPATAPATRP